MHKIFLLLGLVFISFPAEAQFRTQAQQQILTNEDSLHAGVNNHKTIISGYGSAYYQRDFNRQQSRATLERVVLFVGHQFNSRIQFFSELELENALVAGGEEKGEIALEQAFLKFNLNPKHYIVAGLFIPRIGILNENHLPVNFNGVERPLTEQLVIPATWRELGVCLYGGLNGLPLLYTVGVVNGLNNEGLQHGTGLRGGRMEGSNAPANNLAFTASLQYTIQNFKLQASGYVGGTTGLSRRGADSLGLDGGALGTPVYLGEANVQYNRDGLAAKLLGAYVSMPDANKVNIAYAKNLPYSFYGAYAELAYDWLYSRHRQAQFISFARYEALDLNASTPAAPEAIYDGTLRQSHLILGFSYLPIPNIAIKADVRLQHTGEQNRALVLNPAPNALPYQQSNTFLNIGIGYSF